MNSFRKQCTPVTSDSTLPTLLETPNETLSSIEIIASDIGKIMKALKVKKHMVMMKFLLGCSRYVNQPLLNRFI